MPTTIRPATSDDIQLVTDLLVACDVQEVGEPDWTLEDTEEAWRNPLLDLERDTRLVFDGERAVGFAEVFPRVPGEDYDADTYVLGNVPEIDRELIRFVVARARETAKPGATVHVPVHAPNTGRAERLREAGFEVVRTFWRMRRVLDHPVPEPAVPDGVELRPFREGDERAVYETIEAAFATHFRHTPRTYDDWSQQLLGRSDFDPGLLLVATDGDRMAGALAGLAPADGIGWIRTLAVREPWRGRGLGKALLYASFRAYADRGAREVALGVDAANDTGATALYERAGMHVQRRFDFHRKSLDA